MNIKNLFKHFFIVTYKFYLEKIKIQRNFYVLVLVFGHTGEHLVGNRLSLKME